MPAGEWRWWYAVADEIDSPGAPFMCKHRGWMCWLLVWLSCPLDGTAQTAGDALKLLSASAFSETGKRTVWESDITFFNDKESNDKFLGLLTAQATASAADKAQQDAIAKSISDQLSKEPLVRRELVDIEFECHSMDKWKLRYSPRHMPREAATILISDGSGSLLEVNEQNKTLVVTPYSPAKLSTFLFGIPQFALLKMASQNLDASLISQGSLGVEDPASKVKSLVSYDSKTWEIRQMRQEMNGQPLTTWQLMPAGYYFEHFKDGGKLESKGNYKIVSKTDIRELESYRIKKGFTIILNREGKQFQIKSDEFEGLAFDGMTFNGARK